MPDAASFQPFLPQTGYTAEESHSSNTWILMLPAQHNSQGGALRSAIPMSHLPINWSGVGTRDQLLFYFIYGGREEERDYFK